ncbi:hypothetical protein IB277_19260 [Ensifer sp. ENS07]|uniref:hypothetical protein n=1 Tax=Ensifer sp. ENS07 TaxID=2769274 RepID=UPI001786DDDC|nr:hypothetical protein [Ensifer sp. ENS07]MBD9638448.1 hypothetical protein [Ensifer sp. ENS07]
MRQQTKPFIVERKPSGKPKPDAERPSIWERLDADIIAQGLKEPLDTDHAAATGGDGRAQA